ncbi:alanine/ornithine racemase family PLP-dependent enzyme [bacterium]|nr:MAG: alanine/ornithine racemase family PLP-dependent enzyme [bacterium]
MIMDTPRLEIDLAKIGHNVREVIKLYGAKGLTIMGVTKGVCGDPLVAEVYLKNGVSVLGDSRIANLRKMRAAGIRAPFILLRLPAPGEAESVVRECSISLNSEAKVIRELSAAAVGNGARHGVILMVELGDLREGIMPGDLGDMVKEVLSLPGIRLAGIGANLACFGGVKPDAKNMGELSSLALDMEKKYHIELEYVSAGCSTVYSWLKSVDRVNRVNNVRLGDSFLLGGRDLEEKGIPGLHYDAFTLVAEVIESKIKPSVPWGEIGLDAFGSIPRFKDRGAGRRLILNVGRQDILFTHIFPRVDIEILGASSDHLIAVANTAELQVGDEVKFDVDYGAMLAAMTSPYVQKVHLNRDSA